MFFEEDDDGNLVYKKPTPKQPPRKDSEPKEEPKEDEQKRGSEGRFYARIERFKEDSRAIPLLRHHALWMVHNCVSHPVLAVMHNDAALEFHELTSQWLSKKPAAKSETLFGAPIHHRRILNMPPAPVVRNKVAWFVHNAIAHPLIGILPTKLTFDFHDKTAEWMDVPKWV